MKREKKKKKRKAEKKHPLTLNEKEILSIHRMSEHRSLNPGG